MLYGDQDDAISLFTGSTMYSFPEKIDAILEHSPVLFRDYRAVAFIFGTNDAAKKGTSYVSLEVCVEKYIKKVNQIAADNELRSAIVLSPIACKDPHKMPNVDHETYWNFNDIKRRLDLVDRLLADEVKKYPNLHFLSMNELLKDNSGALKQEYSSDTFHFSPKGRDLYVQRLVEFTDTLD